APSILLVVAEANSDLFVGTGLTSGSQTTAIGGWEGDKIVNNGLTPQNLTVLFQTPHLVAQQGSVTDTIQGTFYVAARGAGVFAAGTIGWNWALAEPGPSTVGDIRVQRFTRNLLNWYLR